MRMMTPPGKQPEIPEEMGHKSFVPGCKLDQLLHYTLRGAWGVWESLRMGPGPS